MKAKAGNETSDDTPCLHCAILDAINAHPTVDHALILTSPALAAADALMATPEAERGRLGGRFIGAVLNFLALRHAEGTAPGSADARPHGEAIH